MMSFIFNDTATTEIYTLSLHDALPISGPALRRALPVLQGEARAARGGDRAARGRPRRDAVRDRPAAARRPTGDRKSTRLNSSHANISYAVFCLKKKNVHCI